MDVNTPVVVVILLIIPLRAGINAQTEERNPCSTSPCENGGTCIDKFDTFTCVCLPLYTGQNCSYYESHTLDVVVYSTALIRFHLDYNESYTNMSSQLSKSLAMVIMSEVGQILLENIQTFEFVNVFGFRNGSVIAILHIATLANAASFNPDAVNATVRSALMLAVSDGFISHTPVDPQFLDITRVAMGIDDCAQSPCQNDGICTDGRYTYICTCAQGFSGRQCETSGISDGAWPVTSNPSAQMSSVSCKIASLYLVLTQSLLVLCYVYTSCFAP